MAASIVQKVTTAVASGATRTLTFASAVTAGNTIIVTVSAYDSANAVTWSVTDNKNGATAYTADEYLSKVITGAETENIGILRKDNTAGSTGANSFTVSIAFTHGDTGTTSEITAYEISGLQSTGSLDKHNNTFSISSSTSAAVACAAANSAASGIAISVMALYEGNGSCTIAVTSTGWSNDGVQQDGFSNNPSSSDHKIYTASETSGVTYSHSHTNQTGWIAAIATYQIAGSVGAALAGTPASASTAVGALSTGINLAGTPTSVSTAVGFLMGLMGNAIVASVATGSLSGGVSMLGNAASSTSASGSLATAIQMAATALSSSSAGAALTNWTTVTLGSSLVTGTNSIINSHLWPAGAPTSGTVLSYDATSVTINTDGTFTATSNNFSFVVEFQDVTSPSHYRTAVVTVTPGMVGYVDLATTAAGNLATAIQLVGAATLLVTAAGSMNAQIKLVAAAQAVTAAAGALTAQILLASTLSSATVAQGTLSGTINSLSGNAQSDSIATGFLNAQIQLTASATSLATAVGNLATQIRLAGAALTVSSAQGTIGTGTQLAAIANIQSIASGALITAIRVNGAAIAAAFAVGALTTQIALLGAAVSASSATGTLSAATGIAGAAQSTTTASAQLSTLISLNVSAFSISSADAALLTGIPLEGGAIGQDQATGNLRATGSPVSAYSVDPFFVIGQRRQYFTQRFPVIGPGEEHILTFNFADELEAGETLQGLISLNVIASAGVDGNAPGNLLDGVAAYDTTLKEVLQPIHGAIMDNDYYFTVSAQTSNPFKTLTRFGLLSVRG